MFSLMTSMTVTSSSAPSGLTESGLRTWIVDLPSAWVLASAKVSSPSWASSATV